MKFQFLVSFLVVPCSIKSNKQFIKQIFQWRLSFGVYRLNIDPQLYRATVLITDKPP